MAILFVSDCSLLHIAVASKPPFFEDSDRGIAILLISYLPFRNAVEDRLLADDNGSAQSRVPLMISPFA